MYIRHFDYVSFVILKNKYIQKVPPTASLLGLDLHYILDSSTKIKR